MTSPSEIFKSSVDSLISNIHTSLPAVVISYDPQSNKATVKPALRRNYSTGVVELPILENVPVLFPSNIKFPVLENDYVLLIFCERSIDLWLEVGGEVTPDDTRKYDLSDAIAIPGLQPFSSFESYENRDFSIEYKGSSITIKENGDVEIKTSNRVAMGSSTVEVLQVIDDLLSYLQGGAVTGVTGGTLNPVFLAQAALLQGQLNTIKGTIS